MTATIDVFDTNPSGWVDPVVEARSYVYTWVTAYGEEGPPSAPTVATGKVGEAWTITLTPPTTAEAANRALATTRIYRTVTGSNGIATYYYVGEVPVTQTTFSDAVSDTDAAANNTLETTGWTAPPTDLQGMVSMPNGMIAGWRSNELWFCEPYRPHAWPSAYTVTTEHPIVGLGVLGQSLVVCTSVHPYTATGINPSAVSLSKINAVEPCMSRASIVSTIAGVYYASPHGVVEVTPSGVRNATAKLITSDKWGSSIVTQPLRAAALGQAYYAWGLRSLGSTGDGFSPTTFYEPAFAVAGGIGFFPTAFYSRAFTTTTTTGAGRYQAAGAMIDMNDLRVAWNTLSLEQPVTSVWTDRWTSEVFMLVGGEVCWLDMMATRGTYTWRSKVYQTTNNKNFEAARVWFEMPSSGTPNLTLKVYANGTLRLTRQVTSSGGLIRLPSGFKAQFWQFELTGSVQVYNIEVATSAKELISV